MNTALTKTDEKELADILHIYRDLSFYPKMVIYLKLSGLTVSAPSELTQVKDGIRSCD